MDVRSQILRVSTQLFAARGFDGTSLGAIAEGVGIRKPSLLYHFPSKEQLRLAVLGQLLERWNDILPALLMAAASGEHRFESVVGEMVRFFTEDPDRARLILREILDRPDEMRGLLESHVRPWVDLVANYIRKGQKSGEVPSQVDPEAYTLQVINLVVSGVAAASCLEGGLLPPTSALGDPSSRHARELIRIARVSLFGTLAAEPARRSPSASPPSAGPTRGEEQPARDS